MLLLVIKLGKCLIYPTHNAEIVARAVEIKRKIPPVDVLEFVVLIKNNDLILPFLPCAGQLQRIELKHIYGFISRVVGNFFKLVDGYHVWFIFLFS